MSLYHHPDVYLEHQERQEVTYAGNIATPFVIRVAHGEDALARVRAFTHPGNRRIDVLAASGLVTSVSLEHGPGHIDQLPGTHLIASITGSYLVGVVGAIESGMCVALLRTDGSGTVAVGTPFTMVAADEVSVVLAASPMDFQL